MHTHFGIKQIFSRHPDGVNSKRKGDLEEIKEELLIDDHMLNVHELSLRYGTNVEFGLSEERASALLEEHGPNRINVHMGRNYCDVFVSHVFCGFAAILWIGVLLSAIGFVISHFFAYEGVKWSHISLAVILVLVIFSIGMFGFRKEVQNRHVVKSFKSLLPKYSNVIRNGELYSIATEKLVPGDLVRLRAGDCVPADVRITQCNGLKVDNSSITGESQPQLRTSVMTNLNPIESRNLVFYGTTVIEGSANGIIIACGDKTFIGRIAALTAGLEIGHSALQWDLVRFFRIITIIACLWVALFCIVAIYFHEDAMLTLYYFIVILLASIPEGLLVTMTAALTLTASKMHRKKCLYKKINSIETLGSATVLCLDKTGTITQNKMTVSHMYYDGTIVDVLSENYTRSSSPAFSNLCLVAILCSRAKFLMHENDTPVKERKISGDASEAAVLKWMEIVTGRQTSYIRSLHPKIFEIPFNSTNRLQLSIHTIPQSHRLYLVMKGAPERIIAKCTHISKNNTVLPLDDASKRNLMNVLVELGYMGERVLAFADLLLDKSFTAEHEFNLENIDFPTDDLRFVGFMSMIDPPRVNALKTVQKCRNAGIKVMMVTGDYPITALAIARKVGIISPDSETPLDLAMRRNTSVSKIAEAEMRECNAIVLRGDDIRDIGTEQLEEILAYYKEIVFARTTPQQKVYIVELLQKNDEIVGVTGDGINDSPALKKANIGIAMGLSGNEVTKDAADVIILDDNMETIAAAIEEGRVINDNMKKSITYLLTSSIPEMVPFFLHVFGNLPLALSSVAILLIDVGTDIWPAISLVYEKPEVDVMFRPPRVVHQDHLVTVRMFLYAYLIIGPIQAMAGLACWFYIMAEYGFLPSRLFGIREEWNGMHNDIADSLRREWSVAERAFLESKGYSAYFLGVLLTQIANCITAKTRRLSILHQGMNNTTMNFGILFEVVLGIILVYCPYVNSFFCFCAIPVYIIAPAIPFMILIIVFDETRKYLIRRRPGGWFDREAYF